eukprot:SAG11_NODE_112_length_16156_cov_22.455191_5_plen_64_part_00
MALGKAHKADKDVPSSGSTRRPTSASIKFSTKRTGGHRKARESKKRKRRRVVVVVAENDGISL